MPPVALNLRRPGKHIERWYVSTPAYRSIMEYGEVSAPGLMHPATIKMTVNGPAIDLMMSAWSLGQLIDVSLPAYVETRGLVSSIKINDDLRTADVELRLTGAPWKNFIAEAREKEYAAKLDAAHLQIAKRIGEDMLLNGHPNCRCEPVGITSKKEKRMKVRNRFYLAAPHCTSTDEQAQDNLPGKVAFSEPLLSPGTSGDTSYGGRQSGRHTRGKWTRKNLADAIKHAEQVLEAQPDRDHVAIVRIVRVVRRKKQPIVVEVVK